MKNNKDKTIIDVSDEGIIFADGLLADYPSLNTFLDESECIFNFASTRAYKIIRCRLAEYLFNIEPTRIIHEKISLIDEQWNLYNSL